jgi:hypothetical protein
MPEPIRPKPPEIKFWRHPIYGLVTRNLYRLLLKLDRQGRR